MYCKNVKTDKIMVKKSTLTRLAALVAAMMCALGMQAAEPYACYTPANTTLTFYYDSQRNTRPGTTYDLNEGRSFPGWYTDSTNFSVTQVVFDPSFAGARPTSTYNWFRLMRKLTAISGMGQYLNTEDVTDMSSMFWSCDRLTSLDLSSFNTSKVTDMSFMFYCCKALTSLNLSNFNTAKVTKMEALFHFCTALRNLDLSSFNTENVVDMSLLFYNCLSLTSLDLSSFNTSNVTRMSSMFFRCGSLKTIYVGNGWSTAAVTNSGEMFSVCHSLMGGQGTTYNASNPRDKTYAHIDGGTANPGYFTGKNAALRGDVTGDGVVNIGDVTALIDILLGGMTAPVGADCNGDSMVNIADVAALIDNLLGN